MSSTLFRSVDMLEIELIDAGKKLLQLPSSTPELLVVLKPLEKILSNVKQGPYESIRNALRPIMDAMIAKQLLKHSDMDVNISVALSLSYILRITAPDSPYNDRQMKEFFELVVVTFEKLSSTSGGCYTKMIGVLDIFCNFRLPVLMLDLKLDRLIVCIFKQFLAVADSNSSVIVNKMEKIMSMIIEDTEDSEEELISKLVDLLITDVKKDNKIASPVCWLLREKVVKNCAAKLKPHLPDMPEQVQTLPIVSDDPQMASESVTEVKEKHKRNNPPSKKHAQSVEHGESLVGRTIKIWWSADKRYYKGVVTSFDRSKKKHKVLYEAGGACGNEKVVNLNTRKWILVANVSSIPDSSSNENRLTSHAGFIEDIVDLSSDDPPTASKPVTEVEKPSLLCVQGYMVKNIFAPTLEAIFKKHGDIAAECLFKTASTREFGIGL